MVPGPPLCIAVYCALFYCSPRIFCGLNMCCGYIAVIFLVHIAEKCDLARGVVLFSEHMWCNCVPVHVICGFWYAKLVAYLTGNHVALWVFPSERKAFRRYFGGSVWGF